MKITSEKTFEIILNDDTINSISKAITHLAFRNGPIEDMHSNGQLSEDDMKTLNKFMVNSLATLLTAVRQERWTELVRLFSLLRIYGSSWDRAELDDPFLNEVLSLSGSTSMDGNAAALQSVQGI